MYASHEAGVRHQSFHSWYIWILPWKIVYTCFCPWCANLGLAAVAQVLYLIKAARWFWVRWLRLTQQGNTVKQSKMVFAVHQISPWYAAVNTKMNTVLTLPLLWQKPLTLGCDWCVFILFILYDPCTKDRSTSKRSADPMWQQIRKSRSGLVQWQWGIEVILAVDGGSIVFSPLK